MEKQIIKCFVAGRSGGHLIPALTLAHHVKQHNQNTKILFFSATTALDLQLAGSATCVDWHVPLALDNVPMRKPWRMPLFGWQFCAAFFSARKQLKRHRPTSVLSTGGYISIPVFLAARTLRIPVELFELNVVPGKATTFLAKFAQTIFICFEHTRKFLPAHKCQLAPYPIRHQPISNPVAAREQALKRFHLAHDKKTVLVLGGSQGSVFVNNTIGTWVTNHPELSSTVQIIHQTGAHDNSRWQELYRHMNITSFVVDFSDAVRDFYAAADVVVCRSGAGSLFETLFFQKPCITIPLETAENNHQLDNALAMQETYRHLFSVIRQDDINKNAEVFAQGIDEKLNILD